MQWHQRHACAAWSPYIHSIRPEQSANRSGNAIGQVPKLLGSQSNLAKLPIRSIRRSHQSVSGTQIPGTRCLVPATGSRCLAPGTRDLKPGMWCQVLARYLVPGAWYVVPATRYPEAGTRDLIPGTRYLVTGLVPGTVVPGPWYQVPDT